MKDKMKKNMLRLKKNRKSQLYIITALFLCSLVFLLNSRVERIEESTTEFVSTYNNFVNEAKYAVNSAIYLNRNVSDDFSRFADDYIGYAESKGINAYMFYGIVYDDKVYFANKLNENVNITSGNAGGTANFILTSGNQSTITKKNWLNADIGGTSYFFNTSMNVTEIKLVMKMSQENKTEVRRYG